MDPSVLRFSDMNSHNYRREKVSLKDGLIKKWQLKSYYFWFNWKLLIIPIILKFKQLSKIFIQLNRNLIWHIYFLRLNKKNSFWRMALKDNLSLDDEDSEEQIERDENGRKKIYRRKAEEIEKDYCCKASRCGKKYGSYPALYTHLKTKHKELGLDRLFKFAHRERVRISKLEGKYCIFFFLNIF